MLVLSRKEGEQLLIGDNVVLTINRIAGNRVAIGIDAPKEVPIVRGELDATRQAEITCQAGPARQADRGGRDRRQRPYASGISGLSTVMSASGVSIAGSTNG